MSEGDVPNAVELLGPTAAAVPLVYDSPHSGTVYPDDFSHVLDLAVLQGGEDRFVDDLVVNAPAFGIPLVRALFARTYIDPNREVSDIDPELLDEEWPELIRPGPHAQRGVGLVFRLIGKDQPIYARRLSVSDIRHRIESYWEPFHACLQRAIDDARLRHGSVWHINWHSMQAVGNDLSPDPGVSRPDFVLGDLHGTSCEPEFRDFVAGSLRSLGYSVGINEPYAGAYIVERHGRPREGRHSLQIEINRGLYLDPETLRATSGLATLKRSLDRFSRELARWTGLRAARQKSVAMPLTSQSP